MYKKIISLVIVFIMLLTALQTTSFAETSEIDLYYNPIRVLSLSNNQAVFSEPSHKETPTEFNKTSTSEYLDFEVILVDKNSLDTADAEKIIELIDNGSTLWIDDNNVSLKEVSRFLGIEEPDDRFVRGAQVSGAFIFNHNNNYCFGISGVVNADSSNAHDVLTKLEDETYYKPIPISQSGDYFESFDATYEHVEVNLEDFVNSISKFRSDFNKQACKQLECDLVYMQLPSKSFDGTPYYNYFTVMETMASLTITQYRYDICTYQENGTKKKITDIVTNFTISPNSILYVNNYKTRMHANIANMTIIGQSYLNSNSSSSYTLSGGFSTNGTVINGSIQASTTNTYSTNNQTIQNDFFNQKYKNWNSEPTQKWTGASWELEPCIRILNTDATTYKCQAYSSFQEGGWVGILNVIGANIPFVEVGGAWNP